MVYVAIQLICEIYQSYESTLEEMERQPGEPDLKRL